MVDPPRARHAALVGDAARAARAAAIANATSVPPDRRLGARDRRGAGTDRRHSTTDRRESPAQRRGVRPAATLPGAHAAPAAAKAARREAVLRRRPWSWHAYRAWLRFKANNGTQYSAAITYFSFLALFPLVLLAAAVTGFVLHSDQHLRAELLDKIAKQVPGTLGASLTSSINSVIDARTGVGLIALAGVLLTGLGWIANLRAAIDAVAGLRPRRRSFVVSRLANLAVLAVLGLGVVVSLGLTVAGTAVTEQLLRWTGLAHIHGISYLVAAAGIGLGLLGDLIIFGWVLVRLPSLSAPPGVAFRGVLLASVGFEVLKIVGTYTIARSSHSPTLGPFAGLLAVLIWIELVSRYLLYCVAWIATGAPESGPESAAAAAAAAAEVGDGREVPRAPATPLGAALWLVGAGAAAGAAAVVSWRDRRGPAVQSWTRRARR